MPFDLAPVAIYCVRDFLRSRVLEMHGLTRERTKARSDEEQPRQQLGPVSPRAHEPSRLVAEIKEDGARIEHPGRSASGSFGVDDRGHLAVRVYRAKLRCVLFAFARVDRHHFVIEAELLQQQRYFRGIGGGVKIKTDHECLLSM